MKDKDPNDEEFNQDDQDNINEADDSFGLPDLDFNTLDDEPEAEEESPEPPAAEEETTEAEASVDEEAQAEETEIEEESVVEDSFEAPTEEVSESYEEETGEAEGEEDETAADVPESGDGYVPPKPESNTPRIIAALIVTIVVSGAIWYFAFYRPQKAAEEKARQEQLAKEAEAEAVAAKKRAEEERLRAEQAANEAADADEASANEANFTTISEPTGRYYVVIASFIDADMAADYGTKLKVEGVSSILLAPAGSRKFNRLTLGDFGSFNEAQEEANRLKGTYGDGLWVLKF